MGVTLILRNWLLPALLLGMAPGTARNDPANLCLDAAGMAAKRTGVPCEVLLAVSVVETGRNRRPWPWTVNLGGEGHWLDSAEDAEALVNDALARGATNIDLGCFQLNYRWHVRAFASVPDMLDPGRNALYAAEYLAEQRAETQDWASAAAAYHSATPEHADRYRARFEAAYAAVDGAPSPQPAVPEARINRFPLLVSGAAGQNGSLVPGTSGGLRLIGGP